MIMLQDKDAAPGPKLLYIHMAALGDAIMASPALRMLKAGLPNWRVCVLARSHVRNYFRSLPYVDDIVPFVEEKHVDRKRPWKLVRRTDEVFRLLRRLRGEGFDAVIQWRGQLPDTLMSACTMARHRIAAVQSIHRRAFLPVERLAFLVTDLVPVTRPDAHLVEAMVAPARYLVEKLGGALPDDADLSLDYPLTPSDHNAASAFLKASGLTGDTPFAVVCLSARGPLSTWPNDRFAVVADHLQRQHGIRVVLTGLPEHRDREEAVTAAMRTLPVRSVGRISFGAECALLARSRMLISFNTGISHVAAALRVPVVVLNGRDGACHAPWKTRHRVVTRNPYYPRRHPDSRQWPQLVPLIPARDVQEAIDGLLDEIACRPTAESLA